MRTHTAISGRRVVYLVQYTFWLLCSFAATGAATDSTLSRQNVRMILSLDTRSTIIDRRHVRINGAMAGIAFGEKKHKITAGYYWLGYDAARRLINWHKNLSYSINLSYYTKTDVQFLSVAYWYPVLKERKWTVYVPVEFGMGQQTAQYRKLANDDALSRRNFQFMPCQAGVYSEYRVTPWAGFDAQIGYRNAISESNFRKHFAGIYYSYGISLYPGTIYRDIKGWYKKQH